MSAHDSSMASRPVIRVEIAYATPTTQYKEQITVPTGSTAQQVIERSSVLKKFTEIKLSQNRIGIYGNLIELDAIVDDGDRLEIYRPLRADPKEVRRRLAKEGKTMGKPR